MNAFETAYGKLNSAQKQAVDAIEGPVMVIAGPGTGKTMILALRIANILKKTDTPPSGILAITFTEAGVKNMRIKLRGIIGDRADEVNIFTFHGFAAMVMSDFQDHFPRFHGVKQMTDIDAESLVRDILRDKKYSILRPAGNTDFYVRSIIGSISDAKKEALTSKTIPNFARERIDAIRKDNDSYSTRGVSKGKLKAEAEKEIERHEKTIVFAEIYSEYDARKTVEKRIDFDDLILELLATLKEDKLLLRLLQERYLYVHVDEHQDTNDSQNLLIMMLLEFFETPNIFIVGDEKQAIYRFQGASVENFLRFQHAWTDTVVIPLTFNYRSHQSILDGSFAMIENNYRKNELEELRVKLSSAARSKPRPIEVVTGMNTRAIEEYLSEDLKKIALEEPQATVAVLTKTNKDLERIVRFLESKNIPISSERNVDIFNHPAGSLFFDLINFLVDPARVDLLTRTMAAGLWGISLDESVKLAQSLKSRNIQEILLDKALPNMRLVKRSLINDGAIQALLNVAELSLYLSSISNDPSSVEVWRGIVILSESLVRESDIRNPLNLFEKLLTYRSSADSRSVKVPIGTPDLPVKAMTAHGSKGLEFDYVFILYASEDSWVSRARGDYFRLPTASSSDLKDKDLERVSDARRLFYVAITRTKKHLVVLRALEEDDGRILTPLRFIEELDQKHLKHVKLTQNSIVNPKSKFTDTRRAIADAKKVKLADLSKNVLLEKGLSITALNHFLKCPSKFLYQSVLKLPQAPSVAAEKGTAMHLAISRIWKNKNRSAENIEKIIINSVNEHLIGSLISPFEKEIVAKELVEKAPIISKALEDHFAISNKVWTETRSEKEFNSEYKGKKIKIYLHGRLDAVVEAGKDVFVYDYKTREKMSVPEIKGETASSKRRSNGGYFRQLIFYRILLENNSRFKGRNIIPTLLFLTPDTRDNCVKISVPVLKEDVESVMADVKSLIESVWSGRITLDTCEDEKCEWCRLRKF